MRCVLSRVCEKPIGLPVILALLYLTPLLFPLHDMWDACLAEIGLLRNDLPVIDFWAIAHGWFHSFYFFVMFGLFCQRVGYVVSGDVCTRQTFELTGFRQEGRFWQWYHYLPSDYSAFEPRLALVESLPGTHG